MSKYWACSFAASACFVTVQASHFNRAEVATASDLHQPCTPCSETVSGLNCCSENIVKDHLENSIDEMNTYTDAERLARLDATNRAFKAEKDMLAMKDLEFAVKQEQVKKSAAFEGEMQAKEEYEGQLATIAAQAAQTARLQAAAQYSKTESDQVAKQIASAVRTEEMKNAKSGIQNASLATVQDVRRDTIDMLVKIKEADDAAAAVTESRELVQNLTDFKKRQKINNDVAKSMASVAGQSAGALEATAKASTMAALQAEANAAADKTNLEAAQKTYAELVSLTTAKKEEAAKVNGLVAGQLAAIAQSAMNQMAEVQKQGIKTVQEVATAAVAQAMSKTQTPGSSLVVTTPIQAGDLNTLLPPEQRSAFLTYK